MTRTVWKIELLKSQENRHKIPAGAVLLTAQLQANALCVWLETDVEPTTYETVEFFIVCTGGIIPDNSAWLATFQDGWFVGHVYYRPEGAKP